MTARCLFTHLAVLLNCLIPGKSTVLVSELSDSRCLFKISSSTWGPNAQNGCQGLSPFFLYCVVVYLWGNGANKCNLSGNGSHWQAETRASDYRLCDAPWRWNLRPIIKKESEISWRVWLMVALNRRSDSIVSCRDLHHPPPPPPPTPSCGLGPAVYLTVHFREGLTEVKAVGGFEGRDWQGVCAVPLRDVPRGPVPGCAVGRRDRASTVD